MSAQYTPGSHILHSPGPRAQSLGCLLLLLSGFVWTAIRQAIMASRVERGMTPELPFDCPASVDRIQTACAVDGTALVDSLK